MIVKYGLSIVIVRSLMGLLSHIKSASFGPDLLKFVTSQKQTTLIRIYFHVIILEPVYSDMGINKS